MEKINFSIEFEKINAIGILFWGRSGSLFLGSLLEGHKSILTLPIDVLTTFYDKDGFWELNKHVDDITLLLELFCKNYNQLFGNNENIIGNIDESLFKSYMLEFAQKYDILERKKFFICLHFAYELCLGYDIHEKRIINYQMHDSSVFTRMNEFLKDFSTSKFLTMYREPKRALYSQIRNHNDKVNEFLAENNQNKICSLYTWKKISSKDILSKIPKVKYELYHQVIDGQYLRYYEHQLVGWKKDVVRFKLNFMPICLEKLHDTSEYVMKNIASYLSIDFEKTLLESTFGRKMYYGDKRAVQKINGFSSEHTRISEYHKCFNEQDVYILNNVLGRVHVEYYHLRDDKLPLDELLQLIKIPTKIEQTAFEKTYQTEEYHDVQVSYERRVEVMKRLLTENFTEFALDGFYRE